MKTAPIGILVVLLVLGAGVGALATAAPVETFVMAVGGQSTLIPPFGCATFIAPSPVLDYFGALPPGLPTDGLATCKVAGGFNHQTAAGGVLNDATALSVIFNGGANSFTGSAAANAQSGKIGAKADGTFTGPSNSFIVEGANAFGKYTDPLTLHSPTVPDGTPGFATLGITVHGSLAVAVTGTADVEVRYQQAGGPIFNLIRAQLNGAAPFVATTNGVSLTVGDVLDGFTLGAGVIAGTGQINTLALPMVFGTPFDFTLGILAVASPSTNGTTTTDFFASAQVTKIEATANGQAVTDFSVTAGSGTPYDANGVVLAGPGQVPEPSVLLLLGAGPVALVGARWVTRRRTD